MSKRDKRKRARKADVSHPVSLIELPVAAAPAPVEAPQKRKRRRITDTAVRALSGNPPQDEMASIFRLPDYPPGIFPNGVDTKLAMDSVYDDITNVIQFGNQYQLGAYAEGIGFLGYPYLASLTQRSEHRRPVEVIAEEMTRKWIEVVSTGDKDKSELIKDITESLDKYACRDVLHNAVKTGYFLGMAHIYVDMGEHISSDELQTLLILDKSKINKNTFSGFKVVDPIWTAPGGYDARNPLSPMYYRPQFWYVMGRTVHISRLMTLVPNPVPDMLKPAYNFGGLALTQLMKPDVDNWLKTRQAVADLIVSFSQFVIATNLAGALEEGGDGSIEDGRLQMFAKTRTNRGLLVIDKETELLTNVTSSLSTLDQLQAQAQEHQAASAGLAIIKLFGLTPSGLNTSSEEELRVLYDKINGSQERDVRPILKRMIDIIQIVLRGEIDPEITFKFVPLWQMTDIEKSTIQKTKADTDAVLIDAQVISPDDARTRIAADADSPYHGLEDRIPLSDTDNIFADVFAAHPELGASEDQPTDNVFADMIERHADDIDDVPDLITQALLANPDEQSNVFEQVFDRYSKPDNALHTLRTVFDKHGDKIGGDHKRKQ